MKRGYLFLFTVVGLLVPALLLTGGVRSVAEEDDSVGFYGNLKTEIKAYPDNCSYDKVEGTLWCSGKESKKLDIDYEMALNMTASKLFGSPYDYFRSNSIVSEEGDFQSQIFSTQFPPLGQIITPKSQVAFSSKIKGKTLTPTGEAKEQYVVGNLGDDPIFRLAAMNTSTGLGGLTLDSTLLLANLKGATKVPAGIHSGGIFKLSGTLLEGIDFKSKTFLGAKKGGMCVGGCRKEETFDYGVVIPGSRGFEQQIVKLEGLKGVCDASVNLTTIFSQPQSFSVTLGGSKTFKWKGWNTTISSSATMTPSPPPGSPLNTTRVKLENEINLGDLDNVPVKFGLKDEGGNLDFEKGRLAFPEIPVGPLSTSHQFLWNLDNQELAYRAALRYSDLSFINVFKGDMLEPSWKSNKLTVQTSLKEFGLETFRLGLGFTEDGWLWSMEGKYAF